MADLSWSRWATLLTCSAKTLVQPAALAICPQLPT
jgi:hypothetical protein